MKNKRYEAKTLGVWDRHLLPQERERIHKFKETLTPEKLKSVCPMLEIRDTSFYFCGARAEQIMNLPDFEDTKHSVTDTPAYGSRVGFAELERYCFGNQDECMYLKLFKMIQIKQ